MRVLVRGLDTHEPLPTACGRPESKRFLVDLVHARRTGFDVDKLDYLARDSLAVFGTNNSFGIERIVHSMRVVDTPVAHVAFDDGVAHELADLYRMRARLHRQVYQHPRVLAVEATLVDALHTAGLDRPPVDVDHFLQQTDAVVLAAVGGATVERLLVRHTKVPCTIALATRPCCAVCGHETRVRDAFCAACGASTATRARVAIGGGAHVTPEAAILPRQIADAVGALVRVADIHCGSPVHVVDPHGVTWLDYDPLCRVSFCSGGRPGDALVPETCRSRTVHAFVDAPHRAAEAAERLRAWGEATVAARRLLVSVPPPTPTPPSR